MLRRHRHSLVQLQHADDPVPVVGHGHVTQPAPAHARDCAIQVIVFRDGRDGSAHDRLDRRIVPIPACDSPADILLGDDADGSLGRVFHDDHGRTTLAQARDHLPARLVRRGHQWPRTHVIAHPSRENSGLSKHYSGRERMFIGLNG
jgi:hypothetical protein